MIIFCTTCKNRTQHLELTLPRNLEDNKNCRFVILDYNSEDHLISYLQENHSYDIENGRLSVYNYCGKGPFKMAYAKNIAHRLGIIEGASILCNLDADNYTGKGFTDYISKRMRPNMYLWSQMKPGKLSRGISGRIVVTKDAFIKAGGYNEKYETWSPDDKDFNARLQRLGYTGSEIDDKYLDAVCHNDKMRFKEYKHIRNTISYEDFDLSNEDTTIANFGNFGSGTVYKNFDFSVPIELENLPTRIFGIGLHKTGTTSLHTAFQILGYDSAHWQSAHWAKSIWEEMINIGRSITLERHYAICDLPIPVLYKKLDKAYPGSKFILTIRDEDKWINSIERHWESSKRKWKNDPYSNLIHKEIYGQTDFNKEVFLRKYREHNSEIIDYFSNKNNLLVFRDYNWKELCFFLKKQIPEIPYPMMNGSK